jgi:hypothetical protein
MSYCCPDCGAGPFKRLEQHRGFCESYKTRLERKGAEEERLESNKTLKRKESKWRQESDNTLKHREMVLNYEKDIELLKFKLDNMEKENKRLKLEKQEIQDRLNELNEEHKRDLRSLNNKTVVNNINILPCIEGFENNFSRAIQNIASRNPDALTPNIIKNSMEGCVMKAFNDSGVEADSEVILESAKKTLENYATQFPELADKFKEITKNLD